MNELQHDNVSRCPPRIDIILALLQRTFKSSLCSWIRLWLKDAEGGLLVGEAFHVQVEALTHASSFFAANFSQRWLQPQHVIPEQRELSLRMPLQMEGAGQAYARCLGLMVSSFATSGVAQLSPRDLGVSSVGEVLQLLQAASFILYVDCIEACLEYLSCTRWNEGDQEAIQALVDSKLVPGPSNSSSSSAGVRGLIAGRLEHVREIEKTHMLPVDPTFQKFLLESAGLRSLI